MKGVGFLVWRLKNLFPLDETIQKIAALGVRWVSIKVLDETYLFNHVDEKGVAVGNSVFLKQAIAKFRQAGISVGGWGFIYPSNTAAQAKAANKVVVDLGLDHWLIDAEEVISLGALWKSAGADKAARSYCDALSIPSGLPVGLCSYRFPTYHREFPFAAFLAHPKINLIAPQMYWMKAHNPGEQLVRSVKEYRAFGVNHPIVPIGATFREWAWEPTPGEVKEFASTAVDIGLPGFGFWDLDQAAWRNDWLEAATSVVVPEPEPVKKEIAVMQVALPKVNVRSAIVPSYKYGRVPGKIYPSSKIWFTVKAGDLVEILDVVPDGRNTWARIGQQQYIAMIYDDRIFLK